MTVHPAKNTVHQSIVQIAAYVQLVPTRVLMDPAVYRVLQVTRRNNYFIVDISIVKRQVIRNHFICLARSLYLVIILSFMYFFLTLEMSYAIKRCWYSVLWLTLGYTSFITSELETNNNFDNSM